MTTNNNTTLTKQLNEIKQIWLRPDKELHEPNCWRWHHKCAIARLITTIEQQQTQTKTTTPPTPTKHKTHTTPTTPTSNKTNHKTKTTTRKPNTKPEKAKLR